MTPLPAFPLPDPAARRAIRRRLLAWYNRHARDLPWRRTRDPYAIWVSEIMLQQTQVATVISYFERFMAALPTIAALAEADEHDVLRLWEGLGYYRRARQLHKAAKVLMAEHCGQFPNDPEVVRKLPGIGRYTAGAILSFAFDAQQPILEANTVRLFARLLAYDGDVRSGDGQRLLWTMAECLLPRRGAGRLNQTLMELGSQICTPRAPQCDACPAALMCRAHQQGCQDRVPLATAKQKAEPVREAAVVVRRRGRVLLLRWPEGRRWAGLWDFPRFANGAEQPAAIADEIVDNVRTLTGVAVAPGRHITTLVHGVTRFRITLDCYEAQYVDSKKLDGVLETRWLRTSELADYPLSSTGRKLAKMIAGTAREKSGRK